MKKILLLLLVATSVEGEPQTNGLIIIGDPPPLEIVPLTPPMDPINNPSSVGKVLLGKALFWDEQMSSTKTVACGTCHILSSGGTDPRSTLENVAALNPGQDGVFETADDIIGSPGVADTCQSGDLIWNPDYGYDAQVTRRKSPSVINAGYTNSLLWDGRIGNQLIDPITDEIILQSGAALEALVLGPPINSVEMGHTGRTWQDVIGSIESASPLALSPLLPEGMSNWIGNQSYYQLFEKVYGSSEITASKIAMAIASYIRSLYSNQTNLDDVANGNPDAMNQQEINGSTVFMIAECFRCHGGEIQSIDFYHNTGVVATPEEDEGRFAVTGDNNDLGEFKTPGLRNLKTRSAFMHNGGFSTLEEVVDFYDSGGDVGNSNISSGMEELHLTQTQKDDLVFFLRNSLSDQRVENETGPFSSPLLYSESDRVPTLSGVGVAGSQGKVPKLTANQPPLLGNKSFTVAVENAKPLSSSTFVIGVNDPGVLALPIAADNLIHVTKPLLTAANGDGHVSLSVELPSDIALNGAVLHGRWYIEDDQAIGGLAISELMQMTLFKPEYGHAGKIFSADFEESITTCD